MPANILHEPVNVLRGFAGPSCEGMTGIQLMRGDAQRCSKKDIRTYICIVYTYIYRLIYASVIGACEYHCDGDTTHIGVQGLGGCRFELVPVGGGAPVLAYDRIVLAAERCAETVRRRVCGRPYPQPCRALDYGTESKLAQWLAGARRML